MVEKRKHLAMEVREEGEIYVWSNSQIFIYFYFFIYITTTAASMNKN